MSTAWQDIHKDYKEQDWIDKPSIFAEQAAAYLPKNGTVLELGAGQAQDGCYFAGLGFSVVSTDIEDSALELAQQKAVDKDVNIELQKVDLREELPFSDASFDVVYAHLSLHYFDHEATRRVMGEIERVLKPGGVLAFLVNSVNDPEYKQGEEIEPDYFQIEKTAKRYFSEATARDYTQWFDVNVLDVLGETYKDAAKGVHNLVRFIGTKPKEPKPYTLALLRWHVYDVLAEKSSLNGVMLRGRIRKLGIQEGFNVLAENTQDRDNGVRFAVLTTSDAKTVTEYLKTIADDISTELVEKNVANPILSKLKVNITSRYTL